ncbi:MAG: LptF/LptG family permease, partial [Acidobacteriota bacterium]
MRFSWTISRYLIGAVLPYFIFSWLLLSVILFVQQAGRFSDIFFTVNIPSSLVWQLTVALIPNVIAFTCPMAALVGVIIGLSKMQGDSELVAIRASGIGNFQITAPLLLLGLLLSAFALAVNLYGVPIAAGMVRKVAMQTAIYKLESPIEPGVFNSEIAGYTIYVKTGDLAKGEWKNIFIYNEDPKAGLVRLITSTNGRIDYSGENSELVLANAVVSTISKTEGVDKFVSEKVGEIRYTVKTRRGDLVEKLGNTETSPEELGLVELSRLASTLSGNERTEAQILWQRRIILSITPFVFCILGTSMVLRFHRRGRGFGIFVALLALIIYYLLAFLGEQLARTGRLSVTAGSLIPLTVSALAIAWFYVSSRLNLGVNLNWLRLRSGRSLTLPKLSSRRPNFFVDLTTGLRDFDIIGNLFKFYLLTLGFLTSVFVIFTAFELWKFAGTTDGGIFLLAKYLFFLIPFIYIQLSPSSAMVATLATYVIKSRQNEIVTWTSAGQSV